MYFKRWNVTEKKRSLIVASIKIDYLRQIEHPSDLIVGQKISRIGNSSFDIQSAIFLNNDPKPAANSVVSCVCFDYEQSKSVPVYDEIKADFQLNKYNPVLEHLRKGPKRRSYNSPPVWPFPFY